MHNPNGPSTEDQDDMADARQDERDAQSWSFQTMKMINDLTPDIKGKAFDPRWFLLRQRLDEAGRFMDAWVKL